MPTTTATNRTGFFITSGTTVSVPLLYSVLQKGRIQISKKEQGNREQATGNRFDAVVYENENRYNVEKLIDWARKLLDAPWETLVKLVPTLEPVPLTERLKDKLGWLIDYHS